MGSESRQVSESNIEEVAEWCDGVVRMEHDALDHSVTIPALNVATIWGIERAHIGDMIIKNHNGTFRLRKKE